MPVEDDDMLNNPTGNIARIKHAGQNEELDDDLCELFRKYGYTLTYCNFDHMFGEVDIVFKKEE